MKKKGFTLIELLVVIAIIAMLMAILMPALSKVKKIAARVVCGTNLKGLGTAQTVYANDYDDEYTVQGGKADVLVWADSTSGWQNPDKAWTGTQNVTIGSSLYLLVREADVSPKSFVCPSGDQSEYDGENTRDDNPDIVELWDFGSIATLGTDSGPENHVSYAYHMPYGEDGTKSRYAADGTRSAAFAVMSDKNPWMDNKLRFESDVNKNNLPDSVSKIGYWWDDTLGLSASSVEVQVANSQPHDRESQNVLFADGHSANEKTADVGVKNDNIYTPWVDTSGDEISIRKGAQGLMNGLTIGTLSVQPESQDDSLLLNDDELGT